MKNYVLAILGLLLGFSITAQTASARLDHNEIKIGEQTFIDLQVRFQAASKTIIMPELKDTISKFISIVNVSKIDTAFDEDDISVKSFTQRITITSFDSGLHVIPPFTFQVDNDTLATNPMLLTVNTIPIKAEEDIKDIKNIIEVPFSLWDWILDHKLTIGLSLLFVLLIIGAILLIKKLRNKPPKELETIIPKEAADELALKKLKTLEAKKLWQNNQIKEFQSELSFIIREYIENRFQIKALEKTTDEIISSLSIQSILADEQKSKLHGMLLNSDMAKFAKQRPLASENEAALQFAKTFVEQTKFVEEEEKEIITQNTGKDLS